MKNPATQYVLGFLFDGLGHHVLLMRKERPEWQKGQWNGIGGHVEAGELPLQAMRRECREEIGLDIEEWGHFATFQGDDYAVHCFKCYSNRVRQAESKTDEYTELKDVNDSGYGWLPNLKWLIAMAQSADRERRFKGWYQIVDHPEHQSPAQYTDCFTAFRQWSQPKFCTDL